jgi:hypothetical protein
MTFKLILAAVQEDLYNAFKKAANNSDLKISLTI